MLCSSPILVDEQKSIGYCGFFGHSTSSLICTNTFHILLEICAGNGYSLTNSEFSREGNYISMRYSG